MARAMSGNLPVYIFSRMSDALASFYSSIKGSSRHDPLRGVPHRFLGLKMHEII